MRVLNFTKVTKYDDFFSPASEIHTCTSRAGTILHVNFTLCSTQGPPEGGKSKDEKLLHDSGFPFHHTSEKRWPKLALKCINPANWRGKR